MRTRYIRSHGQSGGGGSSGSISSMLQMLQKTMISADNKNSCLHLPMYLMLISGPDKKRKARARSNGANKDAEFARLARRRQHLISLMQRHSRTGNLSGRAMAPCGAGHEIYHRNLRLLCRCGRDLLLPSPRTPAVTQPATGCRRGWAVATSNSPCLRTISFPRA